MFLLTYLRPPQPFKSGHYAAHSAHLEFVVTDRINEGGNAIASVRPSVRVSVRLFPLYLRNRLTVDLELLRMSRSGVELS